MGVWLALIEIPEKNGVPLIMGYVVWAVIMIPAAMIALLNNKWKLDSDYRSVLLGSLVGLLGAAGQLVLFFTLTKVPASLVFPLLSLTPVLTISLAMIFLKEKAVIIHATGISNLCCYSSSVNYSRHAVSYPCSTADERGRTNIRKIKF
jgi:uncharacterized membrane protein